MAKTVRGRVPPPAYNRTRDSGKSGLCSSTLLRRVSPFGSAFQRHKIRLLESPIKPTLTSLLQCRLPDVASTDGPEFRRVAVLEHYAMRIALGPGKARTSLARKGPCAFVHRTSARTCARQPACRRMSDGLPVGAFHLSPHCESATKIGNISRPFAVMAYSYRGREPASRYGTLFRMSFLTSVANRAVKTLRAQPTPARMSSNLRKPQNASRRTSNDHFSPISSSAAAMEHVDLL
jgi:hypothetical protein